MPLGPDPVSCAVLENGAILLVGRDPATVTEDLSELLMEKQGVTNQERLNVPVFLPCSMGRRSLKLELWPFHEDLICWKP